MRDGVVLQHINTAVNAAVNDLIKQFNQVIGELKEENTALKAELYASILKRQALEDMLFTKSTFFGGLDKEAFEAIYQAKILAFRQKLSEAERQFRESKEADKPKVIDPTAVKT